MNEVKELFVLIKLWNYNDLNELEKLSINHYFLRSCLKNALSGLFSSSKPIIGHIIGPFHFKSLSHTLVKMWLFDSAIADSPDLTSAGWQDWLTMIEPALYNIGEASLDLQLHGSLVIKLLLQDTHSRILGRGQIVLSHLSVVLFQGIFKSLLVLLKLLDVFLISDSIFVDFLI